MLSCYIQKNGILSEVQPTLAQSGCWFDLVDPSLEDLENLSRITKIENLDFIKAALDDEERPRIEIDEDVILIVINIPLMEDENTFDTLPLGIIVSPEYFITVCLKENKVISFFNSENYKFSQAFTKTRLLFQILLRSTKLYLRYLRYINRHTDDIEEELRRSMKNKALFQMLELEKSLVYFTTALKSNGGVIDKLSRLLRNHKQTIALLPITDEDDQDLIEDIIIENKQALEMVEIHNHILSGMMNAFASIINNNLNTVMKFLTTMTILLAIPTMVASFFGMNVTNIPFHNVAGGFWSVVVISIIITSVLAGALWKKNKF